VVGMWWVLEATKAEAGLWNQKDRGPGGAGGVQMGVQVAPQSRKVGEAHMTTRGSGLKLQGRQRGDKIQGRQREPDR